MSQSAALGPGSATLSGVMRIALFEENEGNARTSFVAWPGDRVETNALLMPASPLSPAAVAPSTIDERVVRAPASEPLVTASAALAALLAVFVLTAGSAFVTSVVALTLFW
jgi:hypothetical protein